MNAGNWGAFLQGGVQGAQTEQQMETKNLQNREYKDAYVDPASQANQYDTRNYQKWQQSQGQTPWQDQGTLFDPVRNKLADAYKSAKAKMSSFLPGQGQHAMGPAAQSTVPQGSNVAMSAPGPSSSNPASGGIPGATGPMPLPDQPQTTGRPFADGGIPGRGRSGALRQRKAKPGNIAKPSKAAQAAMHPPMEKPPVDAQEMGAEGGPPRNTDAQPGSQDPMLADGGQLSIKKAIKHPGALHEQLGVPQGEKIPKGKLDAAAKSGGKLGQRARFAETLRKFDDGGMINVARDDAQSTAAKAGEWGPSAAQQKAVAQDQATSDRLSSPNHRLPVTKTPATRAPASAPVLAAGRDGYANGGAVDKVPGFKLPAYPKPQPNALEKDVSNDGQRNRLGKTIKKFADGGPTVPKDQPAPGLEPAADQGSGWPGLLPAIGNSVKWYADKAAPAVDKLNEWNHAAGHGIEKFLTGDPNGLEPTAAASPAATAAPPKAIPARGDAPVEQQGPPAPYDDDPSIIEHGMVVRGPDGKPITPYNAAAMASLLHGSGGGGGHSAGAAPAGDSAPEGANAGPTPGPAAPQGPAPIDFSQIQLDHQDIPNTSTQEWDKMKQGIIGGLLAHRKAGSPEEAAMMADNQVSQFQHQNFMQYMGQGIALDRAGNKQGAMAALKTAYNYMPTGHGMHFGLGPDGNIVGVGWDEDTGKPVGAPVKLDQGNLNHLMATYSDPKNFVGETLAMQEQKRKNAETQAQIGYLGAHGNLANSQAQYYQGRNDTTLEAAAIRHAASGQSRLAPQSQKFYASQFKNILDPRDSAEALGVAEMLEGREGKADPQTQGKIASLVSMMYAMPPEQRQQFALENKIPVPSLTQQTPDPMAYGSGYGGGQGYPIPPR